MVFFSSLLSVKDRLTLTLSKSLYLLLHWWWSSFNLPFFPFCNLTTITILFGDGPKSTKEGWQKFLLQKMIQKVSFWVFWIIFWPFLYFLHFYGFPQLSEPFYAFYPFFGKFTQFTRFTPFTHFLRNLRFLQIFLRKSVKYFYGVTAFTACRKVYNIFHGQDLSQKTVKVRCLF